MPQIFIVEGYPIIRNVFTDLYRLNPKTGNVVCLTTRPADFELDEEKNQIICSLKNFTIMPAVEDVYISAILVDVNYYNGRQLYNIPIRCGEETYMLRCGVEDLDEPPVIYGLWEGYDADSFVFSRNVIPLSKLAGQDYCLLYPIDGTPAGETRYEASKELTMYNSLEITMKELEPGTYYLDYWVEDIFLRRMLAGHVEVIWDGYKITVPDGEWQGRIILGNE